MQKRAILLVLMLLVFFVGISYGQGCSQCKLVAEQGSSLDEASFGTNINYGILFLMTLPYIILFVIFRKYIFGFLRKKLFSRA